MTQHRVSHARPASRCALLFQYVWYIPFVFFSPRDSNLHLDDTHASCPPLLNGLLTNAKAVGQGNNDNYKFLNALGGVLDEKLAAELNLRSSGLDYTIVRPGGLSNEPETSVGNLIVRGEDTTFGLDTDPGREISRDTVAAVCVEALFTDGASKRVVEIVSSPDAPALPVDKWFA